MAKNIQDIPILWQLQVAQNSTSQVQHVELATMEAVRLDLAAGRSYLQLVILKTNGYIMLYLVLSGDMENQWPTRSSRLTRL